MDTFTTSAACGIDEWIHIIHFVIKKLDVELYFSSNLCISQPRETLCCYNLDILVKFSDISIICRKVILVLHCKFNLLFTQPFLFGNWLKCLDTKGYCILPYYTFIAVTKMIAYQRKIVVFRLIFPMILLNVHSVSKWPIYWLQIIRLFGLNTRFYLGIVSPFNR